MHRSGLTAAICERSFIMSHLAVLKRAHPIGLALVDLDRSNAFGPGHPVSRDGRRHEDRGAADRDRERRHDRLDR
jgi:hypothetical protein